MRWIAGLCLCLLLAGCSVTAPGSSVGSVCAASEPDKKSSIPFAEGQCYAVAYLGYQETDALPDYAAQYLNTDAPPVHYISDGDYYLVIPRYSGMTLRLYRNDLETATQQLLYEDADAQPFVVQCNASDIFADVTIQLSFEGVAAEFSPFISLKDGSVEVGEAGLELTGAQTA